MPCCEGNLASLPSDPASSEKDQAAPGPRDMHAGQGTLASGPHAMAGHAMEEGHETHMASAQAATGLPEAASPSSSPAPSSSSRPTDDPQNSGTAHCGLFFCGQVTAALILDTLSAESDLGSLEAYFFVPGIINPPLLNTLFRPPRLSNLNA
jgi:hypothetical protein